MSQREGKSKSMLWGHPIDSWDNLAAWLVIATAVLGLIGLGTGYLSSVISQRVTKATQAKADEEKRASNERVVNLELEKAKIDLELQYLKKFRNAQDHAGELVPKLRAIAKELDGKIGVTSVMDPECQQYAGSIMACLTASGITDNYPGHCIAITPAFRRLPYEVGVFYRNEEDRATAEKLRKALSDGGLRKVEVIPFESYENLPGPFTILVLPKVFNQTPAAQ